MLVDIGLSGSLLRGVKKRTLLADLAGGKRFEDLHVPLWIVAADFVLQREFVFEQGDLGSALDATSAIPAVFPVVSLEDRQLVDGWVVHPLPADVLRRKGADVVIAVDPNVADERKPRPHTGHRRRVWWKRLLSPQILIDPMGMVRVQMQAMDVGAREAHHGEPRADRRMRPARAGGLLDHRHPEAAGDHRRGRSRCRERAARHPRCAPFGPSCVEGRGRRLRPASGRERGTPRCAR